MTDRQERTTARRVVGLVLTMAFAIVLSACSVGGDDDAEVTPTSEATIVTNGSSQGAGTSLPSGTDFSSPIVIGPSTGGSPASEETDSGPEIVVSAPPIDMPTSTPPPTVVPATPVVSVATPAVAGQPEGALGDGTGGANPVPSTLSEEPNGSGSTPVASPVSPSNRANGCDFNAYPPYSGSDALYVTAVDANFRAGPGQDCDAIGEPLAAGVSVEVLSDPVERVGDAEYIWVLVSIDGTQGWLATEVLAPA